MKSILNYGAQGIMAFAAAMPASAQILSYGADNFYYSKSVATQPIHFNTVYNTTIVGNLSTAWNTSRSTNSPVIVVGHPMGAVKEQSAKLYATKLAEQGFITLTLDLAFWGRSEGPQNLVSPDFYTEAYSAAVDHLGTYNFIDRDRIGALGICGSGGFVINAAKIDARIQAVATVSMYDMGTRRWAEVDGALTTYTGGTSNDPTSQTDHVSREVFDFYRTVRGELTPESWQRNQTTRPSLVTNVNFLNFYPFNDI
ncbi:hydrolase of the alpha beta superfamily [Fusarium sp. NRRL 52700]|nr:hydrolase of the alpha beta superfamily [Fusarium sp. NRRL 52700]